VNNLLDRDYLDFQRDSRLEYSRKGYTWLPTTQGEKRPAVLWKKYISRPPSQEEQERWLADPTPTGTALLTGGMYRLVVCDVDPRNGGTTTVGGLPLPETYTVQTPSGGYHGYYSLPEGLQTQDLLGHVSELDGLDLKAYGIVLAPPTRLEAGAYSSRMELPAAVDLPKAPKWLEILVTVGGESTQPSKSSASKGRTRQQTQNAYGEFLELLLGNLGVHIDGHKQNINCFFHSDEHASLTVDVAAGTWHCHAEGINGGVKEFMETLRSHGMSECIPTTPPTPLFSSGKNRTSKDLSSPLSWCRAPIYLSRITSGPGGVTGASALTPCNNCLGCKQWARGVKREHWAQMIEHRSIYRLEVAQDDWQTTYKKLSRKKASYIRIPQQDGSLVVLTTHEGGSRVSRPVRTMRKLVDAAPMREGRVGRSLTSSPDWRLPEGNQAGADDALSGADDVLSKIIQLPELTRLRLERDGLLQSGEGQAMSFTLPDASEETLQKYGIGRSEARLKRPLNLNS